MSLDEKLFGFARRKLLALVRRQRAGPLEAASVSLKSIEGRLRVLASVLAGESIEVRAAEHFGGVTPGRDGVLFLPARIALGPRREDNVDVYLFRLAYGMTSRALGFARPPQAAPGRACELATLLAAPTTVATLERHWPGAVALRRRLTTHDLPPTRSPLEWLRRAALGDPEVLHTCPDPAITAWCRHWVARAPSPAELPAATVEAGRTLGPGSPKLGVDLTLCGMLLPGADPTGHALDAPGELVAGAEALPSGTERTARPREQVVRVEPGKPSDGDNPLVHVFEKLFTAEEYQGGARRMDGADELDEHAEALDELDLRHVVRTADPAGSVYQADLDLASPLVDLADAPADHQGARVVQYDEWDGAKQTYRRDWCTLHDERPTDTPAAAQVAAHVRAVRSRHAREIRQLRAELARLDRQRAPRRRQRSGEEVDIDAVVDHHGDLRAALSGRGHSGEARLYIARRPQFRELATLILVDASLSTDSWVAGQRVMDVARDAVTILGEVLAARDLQVAVAGFYSNSRRDCHYVRAKDFTDSWHRGHQGLLALRPTGYTRIGPAVRHACAQLRAVRARRKLLLLISDGKPTDHDHYEGRYGIADVRQALREGHRDGIASFALAIQPSAAHYLPQLFGRGGFEILPAARHLPASLVRLHERMLK